MAVGTRASDAIALLKADHKRVKALFTEAEGLGDRAFAARAKLFAQIDEELKMHTKIEEEIFYPAFKAKSKSGSEERDEVLEAYEEHAGAKELMAKLENLDPKDETYKAKLQVLSEEIAHHVKEEETDMFPMARDLFDDDELFELGTQMSAMKGEAPVPA